MRFNVVVAVIAAALSVLLLFKDVSLGIFALLLLLAMEAMESARIRAYNEGFEQAILTMLGHREDQLAKERIEKLRQALPEDPGEESPIDSKPGN